MKKLLYSLLLVSICAGAACAQVPTLVKDLLTGTKGSLPRTFAELNGKLYFFAADATNKLQLYRYDDASGVAQVAQSSDIYQYMPYNGMIAYKGKLFFSAYVTGKGLELCSYDGVNPPAMFNDIWTGSNSSTPHNFMIYKNKMYFVAQNGVEGRELFSYDGVNPLKVIDINPGSASSTPCNLIGFNDRLYFSPSLCGLTGLWVYNDVTNTAAQVPGVSINTVGCPIVINNMLYFDATTGANQYTDVSLYGFSSSGSAVQITSASKNNIWSVGEGPRVILQNQLYFPAAADSVHAGLYKYNPASGQVSMVTPFFDISNSPQFLGSELTDMIAYKGQVYFSAIIDTNKGFELYKYDGSTVSLVTDLWQGKNSANPDELTIYNGNLYMTADNGVTGSELYRIASPTGIQAASWKGSAIVYPNPTVAEATVSISLQTAQSLNIILSDLNGRTLYNTGMRALQAGKTDINLPMEHLPAGQYFYAIIDETGRTLSRGSLVRN